ncbi:Translocon-associated protein subunit beta [Thelohanellus kitauei]|uniref:Translocon-associated protein subunit beta n=1 Tax=Thelohanellus kitauei TaxID=669202 RepID=A0A0C2IX85_THEKT|nr:Translocon-associated protein subunit beta [Thelohanellus kitauei]
MVILKLYLLLALTKLSKLDQISLTCFKSLSAIRLVESLEFQIIYSVFNMGDTDVENVVLTDEKLPSKDFATSDGRDFKWEMIPAHRNVTVSVTYVPKYSGYVNITSATVAYNLAGRSEKRVAQSNLIGTVSIIPLNEYLRTQSSHFFGWVVTALLLAPCFVVPYIKWQNVKYLLKPTKKGVKSE